MIVCCCFLSFWLLLVGYRCPLGALFLLSSLYLHYYYYHYSFLYFCLFIFIAIVRWWIDALNARERESKKQCNQKLMYFFQHFSDENEIKMNHCFKWPLECMIILMIITSIKVWISSADTLLILQLKTKYLIFMIIIK